MNYRLKEDEVTCLGSGTFKIRPRSLLQIQSETSEDEETLSHYLVNSNTCACGAGLFSFC